MGGFVKVLRNKEHALMYGAGADAKGASCEGSWGNALGSNELRRVERGSES